MRLFSRFFEVRCRTSLPNSLVWLFSCMEVTAYGKKQDHDSCDYGI